MSASSFLIYIFLWLFKMWFCGKFIVWAEHSARSFAWFWCNNNKILLPGSLKAVHEQHKTPLPSVQWDSPWCICSSTLTWCHNVCSTWVIHLYYFLKDLTTFKINLFQFEKLNDRSQSWSKVESLIFLVYKKLWLNNYWRENTGTISFGGFKLNIL